MEVFEELVDQVDLAKVVQLPILSLLLDAGADPNVRVAATPTDDLGRALSYAVGETTPLHCACQPEYRCDSSVARLLVEAGGDIENHCDQTHGEGAHTPLLIAAQSGTRLPGRLDGLGYKTRFASRSVP